MTDNLLLQQILKQVNQSDLVSVHRTIAEIIRIINDPSSTAKNLQHIIEHDPPLMGKILRIANSVFYSPRKPITDIQKAVIWLGYDKLKQLALTQKAGEMFFKTTIGLNFSNLELWRHSIAVAQALELIYKELLGVKNDMAYTTGLLHQIGLIALQQAAPDKFETILETALQAEVNLYQTERHFLKFDHGELGMHLMQAWNIPNEIAIAVGYHHFPLSSPKLYQDQVQLLYMADYVVQRLETGYCDAPFPDEIIFEKCRNRHRLAYYDLEAIASRVKEEIDSMKDQGLV